MKLAAVSYSNARPLLEGLGGLVSLEELPPAGVAARLVAGTVDAGLVPAIQLARQADLVAVGDSAIAAEGPVWSVLLRLRKPPAEVRSLALDPHSRSSQVLAQIVLLLGWQIRPELRETNPAQAWEAGTADAVLIIGDPALQLPGALEPGEVRLDLAEEWLRLTGHPFVFAVWAAPRQALASHPMMPQVLLEARERGLAALGRIAGEEAAKTGVREERMSVYLRDCIRYRLGAREQAGLRTFLELAREHRFV